VLAVKDDSAQAAAEIVSDEPDWDIGDGVGTSNAHEDRFQSGVPALEFFMVQPTKEDEDASYSVIVSEKLGLGGVGGVRGTHHLSELRRTH